MLEFILLGAQAAGLAGDIWASSVSSNIAKRGQELEESQMELRIKQDRLASNEQSLFNLEQLAETLATQRALMSVRGGLPGVGSSLAIEAKSIARFNKDEQARELSLEFGTQQKRAQMAVNRIALAGSQAQQGAQIFNKAFDMIPFAEMGQIAKADTAKRNAAKKTSTSPGGPNKKAGLLSPQRGYNG